MKRLIFSAALLVISLCTAQAQKFALIDMEFILKHIPAYEQANQQMESLSRQWQSEIEAKSNEAKALYEAYQKEAASLSDAQRTQKRRSRSGERKRGGRTAPEIFRPQGEMMKKQQELIAPIQDQIYNAVKEIAMAQNYDAVIDRASAQSMIFASPRIDISNEVLSRLGYSN